MKCVKSVLVPNNIYFSCDKFLFPKIFVWPGKSGEVGVRWRRGRWYFTYTGPASLNIRLHFLTLHVVSYVMLHDITLQSCIRRFITLSLVDVSTTHWVVQHKEYCWATIVPVCKVQKVTPTQPWGAKPVGPKVQNFAIFRASLTSHLVWAVVCWLAGHPPRLLMAF